MNWSKFFNGLVIGAIAGAAAGWFMHSKKGQEIIDDLHYKALDVKDKLSDKAGALKNAAKEKAGAVKSQLSTVVQRAKDTVVKKTDDFKDAANDDLTNTENSFS